MKKHLHIKRHEKVEKYQNIIFTSMAISRKYAISLLLCAQLTVNIARASGEWLRENHKMICINNALEQDKIYQNISYLHFAETYDLALHTSLSQPYMRLLPISLRLTWRAQQC
jgi:uncharacterized protein YjaG (DUF416 family)